MNSDLTESQTASGELERIFERELKMKIHNNYSSILSCIHDEIGPVGKIGRGCHYSVFEVPQWRDIMGKKLKKAHRQRFAVIWDEDHDERIIEVIEKLYISGLLFPVQFIGERKGSLNVIVAAKFFWGVSIPKIEEYKTAVEEISTEQNSSDHWPSEVGMFDKRKDSPQNTDYVGLMAETEEKQDTYLRNIDNLWNIGNFLYQLNAFSREISLPLSVPDGSY